MLATVTQMASTVVSGVVALLCLPMSRLAWLCPATSVVVGRVALTEIRRPLLTQAPLFAHG